jgi:hypothetical protein
VTVQVIASSPNRVLVRAVSEPGEFVVSRDDEFFGPVVAGDRRLVFPESRRTVISRWPVHHLQMEREDFNGFLRAIPSP